MAEMMSDAGDDEDDFTAFVWPSSDRGAPVKAPLATYGAVHPNVPREKLPSSRWGKRGGRACAMLLESPLIPGARIQGCSSLAPADARSFASSCAQSSAGADGSFHLPPSAPPAQKREGCICVDSTGRRAHNRHCQSDTHTAPWPARGRAGQNLMVKPAAFRSIFDLRELRCFFLVIGGTTLCVSSHSKPGVESNTESDGDVLILPRSTASKCIAK